MDSLATTAAYLTIPCCARLRALRRGLLVPGAGLLALGAIDLAHESADQAVHDIVACLPVIRGIGGTVVHTGVYAADDRSDPIFTRTPIIMLAYAPRVCSGRTESY